MECESHAQQLRILLGGRFVNALHAYSTTNGFGGPMDGCSHAYTTTLSTTMA
jgi:hypothetical protein